VPQKVIKAIAFLLFYGRLVFDLFLLLIQYFRHIRSKKVLHNILTRSIFTENVVSFFDTIIPGVKKMACPK